MMTSSSIAEVFAERQRFCYMLNAIASLVAAEKSISPKLKSLIAQMQEEMDVLYLEASDCYLEITQTGEDLEGKPETVTKNELKENNREVEVYGTNK